MLGLSRFRPQLRPFGTPEQRLRRSSYQETTGPQPRHLCVTIAQHCATILILVTVQITNGSGAALSTVKNLDGSTTNLIFDVHKYQDSDYSGTHAECVDNVCEALRFSFSFLTGGLPPECLGHLPSPRQLASLQWPTGVPHRDWRRKRCMYVTSHDSWVLPTDYPNLSLHDDDVHAEPILEGQ